MVGLKFVLFIKEISCAVVAEKLGVSSQLVSHWVNGVRPIKDDKLQELEDWLKIPSVYLNSELTPQNRLMVEHMLLTADGHEVDEIYWNVGKEFATLKKNYDETLELYHKEKASKEELKTQLITYIKEL
ncbi:helix-turn-helix domain-containing protein [Bacillus thuringiensis]|uniref:helix-turn-helix domain-containing protein n=1 Tax=Bacillus thuringiensis TaxID=1428 RepID=UPI000BFBC8AC|nr:helix-turn-helix transcriptional regulator [Bacillus thuringiensis]PGT89919.1 hypothetical protein COD17_09215 [Bacillus thuringiensis]